MNLLTIIIIIVIIIISSFYSSVEHSAQVRVRHKVLFAVKAFTSALHFFSGFDSLSTVRYPFLYQQVVLSDPTGISSLWCL
jgi:hypothetical protein